jgi:four helix bundle protein
VADASRVERFEDLIAWQKARVLTKMIYAMTKRAEFARDFGLSNQIQRAAVSVMSNIAEGFERSGRAEFNQFLAVAKASCAEVRSQLYVALDIGYLTESEFQALKVQAEEVSRILSRLKASVQAQIIKK